MSNLGVVKKAEIYKNTLFCEGVKSLNDLPVVICYIYKSCPDHLG